MYDGEGWSKMWWSGEVIANEAAFHSKTEVNLESTDSNELFSKMKETVLESLAKFKDKEVIGGSIQFWVWSFTQWSMCHLVVPLTAKKRLSILQMRMMSVSNERSHEH